MRIGAINGRAYLLAGEDQGVDLAEASGGALPSDPQQVFERWDDLTVWMASAPSLAFAQIDPAELELPVPRPRQVFAIGANYRAHAAEAGVAPPEQPVVFTKFPSCLTGPNAPVTVVSAKVDWEAELVVVMGREARNVSRADAWSYVAGLTAGQDISERAIQRLGPMPQFSMAKSLAGFGPIGPTIVSIDEFPNPDDLALGCAVNGEVMQSSRTSDFIFSVGELVEYISGLCTLYPGDLIFTGTPEGVGATRKPPRFLAAGDLLTTWIEGIGELRNPMIAPAGQDGAGA
ncbi:MAG: fumarylacetoacetate hydrolase family protein [Pseudomonadota bacterium]|uniref:fumarylacetoacetate hydrolase family protein n=1 Tax=Phenylobacterium sp. TaxID=1871053 RepID=UPI0025DAF9D3|nr:fumarylacetoacetate hydrolase family protein [Phenylobacterium sp.]MBT9471688.1 fumarylacetoacetate hydrolase family protein [Phenylobacterium sp.]